MYYCDPTVPRNAISEMAEYRVRISLDFVLPRGHLGVYQHDKLSDPLNGEMFQGAGSLEAYSATDHNKPATATPMNGRRSLKSYARGSLEL